MPRVVAVALAAVALSPGAAPRLAATIPTGTAPCVTSYAGSDVRRYALR